LILNKFFIYFSFRDYPPYSALGDSLNEVGRDQSDNAYSKCCALGVHFRQQQDNKTLLNFLVHCPKGTLFIKSMNASAHIKDASLVCELLDGFVWEIGVQNVMQVITDNATNYAVVCKMLMERNHTLF